MKGALFTGLLPILAPDIRWNEGVLRTVTIRAPEGILCNAKWPAPVSGATVCAVWIVMNVAVAALSRMVSCAPAMIREAQAVTKGQMSVLTLGGQEPRRGILRHAAAGFHGRGRRRLGRSRRARRLGGLRRAAPGDRQCRGQ